MTDSIAYLPRYRTRLEVTIQQFIAAKRDGLSHDEEHIRWFVKNLVDGSIPDYQTSAWLMAAYLRGLDVSEAAALTIAMAESGSQLDLAGVQRPVVDKHSTGGVGDAVTLILMPLLAACGLPTVKMSGRGLGFTGGTLDKLDSIPGFRTDLSNDEIRSLLEQVGCVVAGQSADLARADKILYELRDATGTVASVPLIAASIMCKKLAAGADIIVLDVKCGNGAFMRTPAEAGELAKALLDTGRRAGRKAAAIVTDMNQPLAPAVGNALEVRAAIKELQGGCNGRLGEVVLALADVAGAAAGRKLEPRQALANGTAIAKMKEWISAQGGEPAVVDNPDSLISHRKANPVRCDVEGWVEGFDTSRIGETVRNMGGGRLRKEDNLDPGVGVEVLAQIGDRVAKGQPLFEVYAPSTAAAEAAAAELIACVTIGAAPVTPPPVVIERMVEVSS